MISLFPATNLC